MHGVFQELCVLGSSAVLLFGVVLLWRRSVRSYTRAFALQSMVLALLTAYIGAGVGNAELYIVAGLLLLIKGIGIPVLLRRMEDRFALEREESPYVNTATSLLLAGALVLFAYTVTQPLVEVSQLPTRQGMPLAMGLIFVSLLVIVTRRKAITQVVGFLMLENAVALLAVLGAYGVPLVIEIGVFLDVLLGFLVMQIFVYRIHETFESIDVEHLNRLRH